jgi:hypothetical protein
VAVRPLHWGVAADGAADHRVLALCLLPPILAAGTYLRRFGPPGVRIAPLLFIGYLFGFLLRSVITVGDKQPRPAPGGLLL